MSRVPKPVPGCNIKSLPLRPTEAFVWSRIDGIASEKDLVSLTGLPSQEVKAAIERLAALGAIEFTGSSVQPSSKDRPHEKGPPDSAAREEERFVLGRGLLGSRREPAPFTPDDHEDVELDAEKRRRILEVFAALGSLSHYQLLGVPDRADKRTIKSAYYALAPEFHPDKYFRKRLGAYRPKIEAIFTQLTLAHDILTSVRRRGEYDMELTRLRRNRDAASSFQRAARDSVLPSSGVRSDVPPDSERLTRPSYHSITSEGTAEGPAPIPDTMRPKAEGSRETLPPPTSSEEVASRREALARKLGLTSRPPGSASPSAPVLPGPPTMPPGSAAAAAEALKARYVNVRDEANRMQIQRYLDQAQVALEAKDFVSAANAYRLAAALAPDDVALRDACEEMQNRAAVQMAEAYLKQARHEELQGRYGEAALSYSKVCRGRPEDAATHERVAFTTLKAQGDVRRAVEFARRAVELSPTAPEFRLTLARAYFAAGFERSAEGELTRATRLTSEAERAGLQSLISELRKEAKKT